MIKLRGYDYRGGRERLATHVADREVGPWIEIGPSVDGPTKKGFLKASDGYLHPSRWESYGLAVVEALALGIPCLVSSAIHLARPLGAAQAALLADPTPTAIAGGLLSLADAPPSLSVRGRMFVETELDWSRILPGYLAELEQKTGAD
jgi:UDP-glucose:(heptosyl)LPS alpha-1,3-glucosyltransferase